MKEIKKSLKVTGMQKADRRQFYTVQYQGEEYSVRLWEFQIGKERPAEIDCLITDTGHGVRIVQDPASIISQLYPVGATGSFRIKRKYAKYYSVIDINGLICRLTEFDRGTSLYEGQRIDAVVVSTHQTSVNLRMISHAPDNRIVPFRTIEELVASTGVDAERVERMVQILGASPIFEEVVSMYRSGDGHWALEAVTRLEALFLGHAGGINEQLVPFLEIFHKLCICLVEESDILRRMPDGKRREWINRLTLAAQHAEDYHEAYRILNSGEERQWIERQLNNLKESENLYQPERKFRVITCIFNLREDLMTDMVDHIFEIIVLGDKDHWLSEPFRTAFVDMLELFIDQYREKAIRYKDRSLLEKVVKAIAIQQLLSKAEDDINRRLNRATFFRLLAYLDRKYSDGLLSVSFNALFTPYRDLQEYQWTDIDDTRSLYMQVGFVINSPRQPRQLQVLRTDDLEFTVDATTIRLRPTSGVPVPALPNDMLGWEQIEIFTNHLPKVKLKSNSSFETVVKYWKELEDGLHLKPVFNPADKIRPERGDRVSIRVIEPAEDNSSLYCEIVDDRFKGNGWLDLDKVANYMSPVPGIERYFMDPDGTPLIFEADVIGFDHNELEFSMLDVIEEYFSSLYFPGDIVECNIRSIDKFMPGYYLGVTAEGASVKMQYDDDPSDIMHKVVKARLHERNRAAQNQYFCEFFDYSDAYFKKENSFARLIAQLGIQPDTEIEQEPQIEEAMDREVVTEIIYIFDRLAVLSEKRTHTYGYLSLASILASMIGDTEKVEYYDKRKALVRYTDHYERSGYVDATHLTALVESIGEDLINSDYQVNEAITKFQILDSLRHRENVPRLFEISNTTTNHSVKKAADLAIALLLTRRFNLGSYGDFLQNLINQELGVKARVSNLRDFGQESATVEFKTSIIYPSNNHMQPNRPVQVAAIMQTVDSFLNSPHGGDLYFGVNDLGAACGVKADLDFLSVNEDGYERFIRSQINSDLGQIAMQCCADGEWIEDGGVRVFKLHINPAPEMISYRGQYWMRIGNGKRFIHPENLPAITAIRQADYAKAQKAN